MHIEAIHAGIESEAANLAGPATLDPPEDPHGHHPYTILGIWDLTIRTLLDQPTRLKPTIARSAAYLTDRLTDLPHTHPTQFEDLAADLAACRTHLEQVGGDSHIPDLGAPCPRCRINGQHRPPRLAKHWATNHQNDRWICPRCGATYTEDDYRYRVSGDYIELADALTATQLHNLLGVRPGTIRAWATRGKIRRHGRSNDGRMLYDVADTRAAKLAEQTKDV